MGKIPAVARAKVNTLISGPTGAGKEVLARALHASGCGPNAPFVPLNCGAMPAELIESELFGHARGAFTGATARGGLVRAAQNGVLFLDEINTSNVQFQAKLLRFLENMEYRPVGSDLTEKADNVWVLTATNVELHKAVAQGEFREDLMYRVGVVRLDIPPLRQRPEDIAVLAQHFLTLAGKGLLRFTERALAALVAHDWPGNVRELKHSIEQAVIFADNDRIDIDDINLPVSTRVHSFIDDNDETLVDLWQLVDSKGLSLGEAMALCEQKLIRAALRVEKNNRSRAAQRLGIHNRTIFKKLTNLN